MKRSEFIKLSTLASGGLFLFSSKGWSQPVDNGGIGLPQKLVAYTNNGVINMHADGEGIWGAKDISIKLKVQRGVLTTFVNAKYSGINKIRIAWQVKSDDTAKFLGDHWERAYGDLPGDLSWEILNPNRIMPWYMLVHADKKTTGYGVETGGNSFCSWQANENQVILNIDIQNGSGPVYLAGRTLEAATIYYRESKPGESSFDAAVALCAMMCPKPRLTDHPVFGINDWYYTFGNNSRNIILNNTRKMAVFAEGLSNRPYSIIDAGWTNKSKTNENSDWAENFLESNTKFGDMSKMADDIRRLDMKPGIWTRPMCGEFIKLSQSSRLIKRKSAYKLLDPSIDENLAYIGNLFKTYRLWGYDIIKHDFTTQDFFGQMGFQAIMANQMATGHLWHFNDKSKTNAEILKGMFQTIRNDSDNVILIGCNTVSHLSAGFFEIQRIAGDNTTAFEGEKGHWPRTKRNGLGTLAMRMPQNMKFYANDADCVALTKDDPWYYNKQFLHLVSHSNTPLFVSCDTETDTKIELTNEVEECLKEAFKQASVYHPNAEPQNWIDTNRPDEWLVDGKIERYDWG